MAAAQLYVNSEDCIAAGHQPENTQEMTGEGRREDGECKREKKEKRESKQEGEGHMGGVRDGGMGNEGGRG